MKAGGASSSKAVAGRFSGQFSSWRHPDPAQARRLTGLPNAINIFLLEVPESCFFFEKGKN
jgi:hypothetical protein